MELSRAIELISKGIQGAGVSCWADLGCGSGLFTKALAELLDPGSTIYAVDTNKAVLAHLHLPSAINLQKRVADFVQDNLLLSSLDGIVMANSLHYVHDKIGFIAKARNWLKEGGHFILIEYDMDTPNSWVPYPLSFESARKFFKSQGFHSIQKLGQVPSIYRKAPIYAALIKR